MQVFFPELIMTYTRSMINLSIFPQIFIMKKIYYKIYYKQLTWGAFKSTDGISISKDLDPFKSEMDSIFQRFPRLPDHGGPSNKTRTLTNIYKM